jgi:hypothetical protein
MILSLDPRRRLGSVWSTPLPSVRIDAVANAPGYTRTTLRARGGAARRLRRDATPSHPLLAVRARARPRANWKPMPFRVATGEARPPGPKPFSREWLQAPPELPVRRIPSLPIWFPSDRALIGILVLLLVFGTAFASGGGEPSRASNAAPAAGGQNAATGPTPTASAQTVITEAALSGPTATLVPGINVGEATTVAGADGELLPHYRILSFYGHPLNDTMGILGEYPNDKEGLLAKLREQAASYEAADPSHPVLPAFEVIASVGQDWPAENNTYLMHTGADLIDDYANFCEQNGLLLILDVQIGHSTVKAEIESVRKWLEKPFVHLALDPEFATPSGVAPGSDIGGIDASDVSYAQDALGQIVDQLGLPPKILIVHRFTEGMLRNDAKLEAVPGVQLVIDFDGYGEPAIKQELYRVFTGDRGVKLAGIKLFYRQDSPLMTPAEVVGLDPSPVLVIYQ